MRTSQETIDPDRMVGDLIFFKLMTWDAVLVKHDKQSLGKSSSMSSSTPSTFWYLEIENKIKNSLDFWIIVCQLFYI